ncbi:MBL fold metallo-hydrolase [Candidatus Gottesmanbacteria bacterium]|nr:MBL fold metallo-hydrolase [Candidatus Gottesmanbacteria bacterium]
MSPIAVLSSCNVYRLITGQMASNCYLVVDRETTEGVVIDLGDDAEYITDTIVSLSMKPNAIVATHGHFDHIMAAFALQQTFNLPFFLNSKDHMIAKRMPESAHHFLGDFPVDPAPILSNKHPAQKSVRLGKTMLTMVPTPGHTPGSMTIVVNDDEALLVGDVLFQGGGRGRTDFSYSDEMALQTSIRRILAFKDTTLMFPGHGEPTSVRKEKRWYSLT